jgi:hypothetical protein
MRLPGRLTSKVLKTLQRLSKSQLISLIKERRKVIRYHRDQKGDNRCWLDDFLVWDMLENSTLSVPDSFEGKMKICREFYTYRRAKKDDSFPVVSSFSTHSDRELKSLNKIQLILQIFIIQGVIGSHRDISGRPRSNKDDAELYLVLPEDTKADFRLPKRKEFLGEAKAPNAGCPSFWRSHELCEKRCDFTTWGPCK